ncbi:hypothetical protein B0T17DRAFT_488819 [Bombardia bombarda]|uniref:Uncharacterized protein n=1 Tax=Bombardia bombarda TaxID=252184 RepID=A0AA39X9B9_9PEZI|nr:hypothetical protein B0T17DRAFT_488819 [Bombardia bombarda]
MAKLRPETTKQQQQRSATLPEFDSLRAYHVDDKAALALRNDEVARLLTVVHDPKKPVRMGASRLLEGMRGNDAGYQKLSKMSMNISMALSLCLLDNECINVEFCSRMANRERLQKLIRQAHVAATMTTSSAEKSAHDDTQELKTMFAIVNYISATLARLVSQTASGNFWITNIIATLAARVTKIKFLLVDITTSAAIAAATGEETLDRFPDLAGLSPNAEDEEEECDEAQRIIDANTKEGLTSEEDAAMASYCVGQNKYRSGINSALKYILLSLRLLNRSGLPATTYEMCVVVYELGFEGFKTVLFQDRDLEYSASSERDVLNTTQPALSMLNQVLREMDKQRRPILTEKSESDLQTYVEWAYRERDEAHSSPGSGIDYSELSKSTRRIPLSSMADIFTVMVPLIATSPILLSDFTSFRTAMALTGGVQDVVTPFQEGQFGAFCRLYTNQFDQEVEKRQILRLSKAFVEQRFSCCRLLANGDGNWKAKIWSPDGEIAKREPTHEVQERLDDCYAEMKEWVVDETSVTISLRIYVSSVIMFAVLLGAGGLAIGFTVGDRITGVDPFNLATYTWVLAAFVLLICKSVLVENWTWSDFLRRRVRCRSVSELAATSGIDEQLIMAKLLHDDCGGTILLTRGPYNSVFRRQTDGNGTNGFSIDRPISSETLMLSGLALLKVVTPRGNAIVCLDYRQGTYLTVVEHQVQQSKSRLICEDLNPISKDNRRARARGWRGAEPARLRLTKKENFKWKRVQGLYDFNGVDVVFE